MTRSTFILVGIPLTALIICTVYTRTRILALIIAATIALPSYAFELYLGLTYPVPFSKSATTLSLRAQGVQAYPAVFPIGLMDIFDPDSATSPITVGGKPIMPLSGIPNRTTVYCTGEDGIVVYKSDRLGFRNPQHVYQFRSPDVVILGDSFVQGYCVPQSHTYSEQFSILGRSINFGMNGTSPLVQYAIYKEFVGDLRPKRLIWFFYEGNDLFEFVRESNFEPTRAYLDDSHSQGLVSSIHDVGSALERYIDAILSKEKADAANHGSPKRTLWSRVRSYLTLQRLQLLTIRIFLSDREDWIAQRVRRRLKIWDTHHDTIETIWQRVIAMQRQHAGTLTFVYIPMRARFQEFEDRKLSAELERRVLASWSRMNADHMTLTDLFSSMDNPLFLYDSGLHFNKKGYEITAQHIIGHIVESSARKPN